jgi:hypothetical protein
MKVTMVVPAIGDLRYASREQLLGLALFLQETNPRAMMPRAEAA